MTRGSAALLLGCLISHGGLQERALASADPEVRLDLISPDAFAGSSVNVVAGLQHTLFTHGEAQYAAFYAGDGTLVLARRDLPDETWTTRRTPYRADVNDAHRTVALAVDGDGFPHVAWDHHNNPLNYARSVAAGRSDLHLVYRDDDHGGRIIAMSCSDLDAPSPRWTERELTTEPVGAWEPSLDPIQAARGVLEMLVQRVEQRDGDDREAAPIPPSPVFSLSWTP